MDLLTFLGSNFPQVFFILMIALVAAIALREFRSMRKELLEEIQPRIKAEIAALLGDIYSHNESILKQLKQAEEIKVDLLNERNNFSQLVEDAKKAMATSVEDAREASLTIQKLIPMKKDIGWIRPRDLVNQAEKAADWPGAYQYLAMIDENNATSSDLERAGDICRSKHGFIEKAIDFYKKAVAKDPNNLMAQGELLALVAETRFKEREGAIADLKNMVLNNINNGNLMARYFNTLIQLARFNEMAGFCEQQLSPELPIWKETKVILYRNLAVANKRLNNIAQALQYYNTAIALEPSDENSLFALSVLLIEEKNFADAFRHIGLLLKIDPKDAKYYILLARVAMPRGDSGLALKALDAAKLYADSDQKYEIQLLFERVQASIKLNEFDLISKS